jgi:hypothetical protein
MNTCNRREFWESLAGRGAGLEDPRFVIEPGDLDRILLQSLQSGVALGILGRVRESMTCLDRCKTALKSKVRNQAGGEFGDLLFYLLLSWIREDDRDSPGVEGVLAACHRQILAGLRQGDAGELFHWYQEVVDLLRFQKDRKAAPGGKGQEGDGTEYFLFARAMLDIARLLLWKKDPHCGANVLRLIETAFQAVGEGNRVLVERAGIRRKEINYARLGSLGFLGRPARETRKGTGESIRWDDGQLHFFHAQCRVLAAFAHMIELPVTGNIKDAGEAVESLFADARDPKREPFEGLGFPEQLQWAYLGGAYTLQEHSKKPINVIRHYLAPGL